MATKYYRFVSAGRGIYEAVEFDCPRGDPRRDPKPDGSWVPKVGANHPGAVSFWTDVGLRRYVGSGLQAWHASVVNAPVDVLVGTNPSQVLYSDEVQIICLPGSITLVEKSPAAGVIQTLFKQAATANVELSDHELLTRFESCELSADLWVHRTHVRVGYLYLRRHSFDDAFNRMRAGIKALNRAHGVIDTPTSGYHDTLTGAWLRLIDATVRHQGPGEDSRAFCEAQPQLLSKKALRFFYSPDHIMSAEARATFVEPDLTRFPK